MAARVELACKCTHGEWDLVGYYETVEDAVSMARQLAAEPRSGLHVDDFGAVVFGIAEDAGSDIYDLGVEVYADGEWQLIWAPDGELDA